jgi:hypothetical protein
MPKVPVDYSKTCIYKLVHFDDINDENIYIGHTINMIQRKHKHKYCCNNPNNKEYNSKKYQYIREKGSWKQWRMILVEKYPCNDVDEAKARERHWIKELKAKLNMIEPSRTEKEYYEDNKEQLIEKQREYYKNNKDKIAEKYKEYYENNKDKIAEYQKEHYEEIKQKLKEKTTCECGSIISNYHIVRHRKTIKHQEWLKNNNLCTN